MINSILNGYTTYELVFLAIGFFGQGLFASRFIIQWIYSERKGESTIPVIFWFISVFGGLALWLLFPIYMGLFAAIMTWKIYQGDWKEIQV